MITFQTSAPNLQHLTSYLYNVIKNAEDGPGIEVMQDVGKEGIRDVQERFNTQGFGTWKPLSPLTIQRKGHSQILFDTGNMKNSIGIGKIETNYVSVTIPHAGKDLREDIPSIHQLGKGKIPQRKIVEVTDQLINRINPVIERWYQEW